MKNWPVPKVKDFVLARFPEIREPMTNAKTLVVPGPKLRPAFVCDVLREKGSGKIYVKVAPGTTQDLDKLYPGEFSFSHRDLDAIRQAGLSVPCKFSFGKMLLLPWDDEYFGPPTGRTHPVLGSLANDCMKRVGDALSKIGLLK